MIVGHVVVRQHFLICASVGCSGEIEVSAFSGSTQMNLHEPVFIAGHSSLQSFPFVFKVQDLLSFKFSMDDRMVDLLLLILYYSKSCKF